MTNVTIIGGSGFIGTRLCRRFRSADINFSIVDKVTSDAFPDQVSFADVRDLNQLRESVDNTDCLVNLAAEHRDDVRPKKLYDEVNVQGAHNVCQIARERGVDRLVFTSSVAVYGFAPPNTGEDGAINPFNDYGRTKAEAEQVYRAWQAEDPQSRSLVIIRPTVVFGENNRGNVFNLLKQIASGRFVMIGSGMNAKSMAYVENVAAFIQFSMNLPVGIHTYNYIDKPDFTMSELVGHVRSQLGKKQDIRVRIPYPLGLAGGVFCDVLSKVTGKSLPISSIRVQKFCATTQFSTTVAESGFRPPVTLQQGLERTVQHEFLENHKNEKVFFTE